MADLALDGGCPPAALPAGSREQLFIVGKRATFGLYLSGAGGGLVMLVGTCTCLSDLPPAVFLTDPQCTAPPSTLIEPSASTCISSYAQLWGSKRHSKPRSGRRALCAQPCPNMAGCGPARPALQPYHPNSHSRKAPAPQPAHDAEVLAEDVQLLQGVEQRSLAAVEQRNLHHPSIKTGGIRKRS